jgi:hypothetical protein
MKAAHNVLWIMRAARSVLWNMRTAHSAVGKIKVADYCESVTDQSYATIFTPFRTPVCVKNNSNEKHLYFSNNLDK